MLDLSFDRLDSLPPETPTEMVAKFGVTQDLKSAIESVFNVEFLIGSDEENKIMRLKFLYFRKVDLDGIKYFLGI